MQLARALVYAATFASIAAAAPSLAHADAKPQAKDDEIEIQLWGLKKGISGQLPDIEDPDQLDKYWQRLSVLGGETNPTDEQEYFNAAHCSCDDQRKLRVALISNNLQGNYDGDVEMYAGQNCEDKNREAFTRDCRKLSFGGGITSKPLSDWKFSAEQDIFLDAKDVMDPVSLSCGPQETIGTIWLLIVNRSGAGTNTVAAVSRKDFDVDTQAPTAVTDFKAEPGEDGIYISWKVAASNVEDIWYYHVLCSRADGSQLLDDPTDKPQFQPACGVAGPAPVADAGVPADAAVIDAAPRPDANTTDAAPTADLNPELICGSPARGDSSGLVTVPASLMLGKEDLINVQLLVMDEHHNVVASSILQSHIEPVHDFWEVYEDQGGTAEGGFCFVATAAYGDYDHPFVLVLRDFRDHTLANYAAGRAFIAWYYRNSPPLADFIREHAAARLAARVLLWPVVILAGTWEYTTVLDKLALFAVFAFLVAWRRKRKAARRAAGASAPPPVPARTRRRRLGVLAAGATTLLVLLFTAHVASAQSRWDDEELDLSAEEEPHSDWVFEIKFGPYTPNIDDGFPAGEGPYALTYGDPDSGETDGLISQIELDRFFLFPGGQLGAFAGVGYFQKWAHAFKEDDAGNPLYDEPRSTSDRTYFRLVPLYAGAVYRYTQLADQTVIPLVPYAKLGLAYDIWWTTKGNGDISKNGNGDPGKGGTLGWQGSLGLSIRADAIDPGAARNMQVEMGVEHVGFFGEVTYSDVSGLGMAHKLPVGDLTWSLGVNFEF